MAYQFPFQNQAAFWEFVQGIDSERARLRPESRRVPRSPYHILSPFLFDQSSAPQGRAGHPCRRARTPAPETPPSPAADDKGKGRAEASEPPRPESTKESRQDSPVPDEAAGLETFLAALAQPWAEACKHFAKQAGGDQATDSVPAPDASFSPPVDVFDTQTAYLVHVSLPGAKKEDIGVHWDAEKHTLNIAGVLYRANGADHELVNQMIQWERPVGLFERAVRLPLPQRNVRVPINGEADRESSIVEIDTDHIVAKLEDGVLVLTVPKLVREKEWVELKKVDVVG